MFDLVQFKVTLGSWGARFKIGSKTAGHRAKWNAIGYPGEQYSLGVDENS